jgi:Fe-S oxidoreductase
VLRLGEAAKELAPASFLFEEFIAREARSDRFELEFRPLPRTALLHGHCHQKAFAVMPDVDAALALVPELKVQAIESSCCGMAGSFGYEAAHREVSLAMAEASLLPAVRSAAADALIVADGTSCRQQIRDCAQREVLHVAQVLAMALPESATAR